MPLYGDRISGAILAGGRNSRLPYLKGFIRIDGTPIIERNLSILSGFFDTILISANDPKPYEHLNCPIVRDSLPSRGPMSGIYSCLEATASEGVFVVTCDMPCINHGLIEVLCECYLKMSKNIDAIVPVYRDKVQPLFGIYCASAKEQMKRAVLTDRVMMIRFLEEIDTHYIDVGGIIQGDMGSMAFVNINTPKDLEELKGAGFDISVYRK